MIDYVFSLRLLCFWQEKIFSPKETKVFPKGKEFCPTGKMSFPEGISFYPKGKKFFPMGIIFFPKGQKFFPEGKISCPKGKKSYPKGKKSFPLGKKTVPMGKIPVEMSKEAVCAGCEAEGADRRCVSGERDFVSARYGIAGCAARRSAVPAFRCGKDGGKEVSMSVESGTLFRSACAGKDRIIFIPQKDRNGAKSFF
ncbi:MAG: hypothetical protein LBP50_07050 [Tannerella sp.]|nr:hypothetical protein [Tannerella sp.]